jgi:hypothetical protein
VLDDTIKFSGLAEQGWAVARSVGSVNGRETDIKAELNGRWNVTVIFVEESGIR